MKTIKDVRFFFEHDLKAALSELEQLRLNINQQYSFKYYRTTLKILGVLAAVAIITSMVAPNSPLKWGTMLVPFTAVVAIVYPIVLLSLRASKFKTVNRKYKEMIIPNLLAFIQPRLTYVPDKGMTRSDVDNSLLFENEDIRFRSEDLVQGSIGGFNVRFADVTISQVSHSSSSRRKSRRVVIFSGLFLQVNLEKKLTSRTIIAPDIREGIGGRLARKIFGDEAKEAIERLGERLESLDNELIKMTNPRFEKYFSVYTQNEKEAKALLTPSLMDKLIQFREKNEQIIRASFTNEYLTLAIDAPDMLESGVDESFLRFENFEEYVEMLLMLLDVLAELPLQRFAAVHENSKPGRPA